MMDILSRCVFLWNFRNSVGFYGVVRKWWKLLVLVLFMLLLVWCLCR